MLLTTNTFLKQRSGSMRFHIEHCDLHYLGMSDYFFRGKINQKTSAKTAPSQVLRPWRRTIVLRWSFHALGDDSRRAPRCFGTSAPCRTTEGLERSWISGHHQATGGPQVQDRREKGYPLVSSNMAGWKIPELNGSFNRKITYISGPFSIAMFD